MYPRYQISKKYIFITKDQKKYRQPLLWKANRYRRQQTWKVSVERAEIASFLEMRELGAKSQLEF